MEFLNVSESNGAKSVSNYYQIVLVESLSGNEDIKQ